MRSSSLAAVPFVRIEKLTAYLVRVRHRVVRIAGPVNGYGETIKTFKVTLDPFADDLSPAALETVHARVQRSTTACGKSAVTRLMPPPKSYDFMRISLL